MDHEALLQAMRLAGKSPLHARGSGDLGRFGLGLKTATLSQARELTVLSKNDGQLMGARWSLDHLARTGRWALLVLNSAEMETLPEFQRLAATERARSCSGLSSIRFTRYRTNSNASSTKTWPTFETT